MLVKEAVSMFSSTSQTETRSAIEVVKNSMHPICSTYDVGLRGRVEKHENVAGRVLTLW